ncbi:unnamed protein product [Camellia sinensis]
MTLMHSSQHVIYGFLENSISMFGSSTCIIHFLSREGTPGWRPRKFVEVPQSPDDFNKWAGKMRFLIGDSLVLEYNPKSVSVLEVIEEDYKNCITAKPIKAYNDSNTKIVLDHSGLFYFISGAEGHCEKGGQKLLVRVLSAKCGSRARPPVALPAPAPSPVELLPPAPVPTADGGTLKGEYVCMAMFLGSLVGLALM